MCVVPAAEVGMSSRANVARVLGEGDCPGCSPMLQGHLDNEHKGRVLSVGVRGKGFKGFYIPCYKYCIQHHVRLQLLSLSNVRKILCMYIRRCVTTVWMSVICRALSWSRPISRALRGDRRGAVLICVVGSFVDLCGFS
jgi:hypothetical protein